MSDEEKGFVKMTPGGQAIPKQLSTFL